MHCKSLCINGDAEKSYTYKILRTPEELHAGLAQSMDMFNDCNSDTGGASEERRLQALQTARSKPYGFIPDGRKARRKEMQRAFANDSAIKNLRHVLKGALPNGWLGKSTFILGGIFAKALLTDFGLINGAGTISSLRRFTCQVTSQLCHNVSPSTCSLPKLLLTRAVPGVVSAGPVLAVGM